MRTETFNEFFYRKLKPDARPVEDPDDPYRLVSGADCRLMVFETVSEATRLWIKGRDFSVGRLLGDTYRAEADKYVGGALCIFRLAPQDYHRFHSPVDGIVGPMTDISGEYYTVNVSSSFAELLALSTLAHASLSSPAASYPHGAGRVWRERTENCADRLASVRARYVRVHWRDDGRQHQDDGAGGTADKTRRRVWILRVRYVSRG